MAYLKEKFSDLNNINNNKIEIVSTNFQGKEYFRLCIMDPYFKDYINEWFEKFLKEYEEYKGIFDDFVKQRVSNIMSIAEEC